MPHSRSRSRSRSPRPTRHDRYRDSADRDRERRRDERGDYRYRSRERDRERDRDRDRRRHHDDRSPKHASGSGWELAKRDKRDSEHGELQRAPKSRSGSPPVDKTKPNFNLSGKLAAATNTIEHAGGKTTLLKYNEPPEARKPGQAYRLYVFKGDDDPVVMHVSRQSAYLIGRDRLVADIPLEHPSCSKQHAALQYRAIAKKNEYGESKTTVKPFIIDLESTNGTHVNGEQIPTSRYFELQPRDVLRFGLSAREYVFLVEQDE